MPNVYDALTARMNYLTARQGVIAGNIANSDTPGYIDRDLVADSNSSNFAMMVSSAGHMSAPKSADGAGGKIVEDKRFLQHNGNSVRLDQEMLKMNDTQLNYQMMTQLYAKQVALQKLALSTNGR